MRVAICDDESVQCKLLRELVDTWADKRFNTVTIQAFDSAEAFLFTYAEDRSFDILLLDIQMKAMDGVALAKEIRKENERLQIVFITGFSDYIAEGYEVSALHYLLKPVKEDKLFQVLDRAASRLQASARTILFETTGGNLRIPTDDIYFAETYSHHVTLNIKGGQQNFNIRLGDMEEKLGEGFFRCHRSYIVGMKHVRQVTRNALILDTGREIPLSRRLYDNANQAFIRSC